MFGLVFECCYAAGGFAYCGLRFPGGLVEVLFLGVAEFGGVASSG